MADVTYNPGGTGIRREQGGRVLAVGSTGEVNIEDGGKLTFPVTTQTTTSGTITNFGLTKFGTTIAAAYTLANPDYAGQLKILSCTVHGATTVTQTITTASTACTIAGTSSGAGATIRTLTFTNAGQSIALMSLSSTSWVVISNVNTVALTS